MKRVAILITLVGVICWGAAAQASRVTPPIRWEGDPDEFQAKRILDVGGLRSGSIARAARMGGQACGSGYQAPMAASPEARHGRTRISAELAGRTFLWEK
jgi:hypothetical protein